MCAGRIFLQPLFAKKTPAPAIEPGPPATLIKLSPQVEVESVEARLFEEMDKAALAMVEKLQATDTPWQEQAAVFRMIMEWLAKSKRLRSDDDDGAPRGVEAMREFIQSVVDKKKPVTAKGRRTRGEGAALEKALGADE